VVPAKELTLPVIEGTGCRYGGDYPFCNPAPYPGGGMDPGTGSEPIGGGTGEDPAPSGSELKEDVCPAATDPTCKQPLQDADKQSLASAIQRINRNADAVCAQLADKLVSLGSEHIFRGAYDSGHTGEAGVGDIHIDPRYWDAANSEGGARTAILAEALLHEAAHLMNWDHAGETHTPYHSFPFDHMFNPGSGVPQCVP
jgi:hypothetical protein